MPQVIIPSQDTVNALVNALRACAARSTNKDVKSALALYDKEQAEQLGPALAKYREVAENKAEEGRIEVDPNAHVSKADVDGDEGAYVSAWLWVPDEG